MSTHGILIGQKGSPLVIALSNIASALSCGCSSATWRCPKLPSFKRVLLHDRRSATQMRFGMWRSDFSYLRKRISDLRASKGDNYKMRADCAKDMLPGNLSKTVWIVQRRVPRGSRVIDNIVEFKELVQRVFGNDWNIVEFDSGNTVCKIGTRACLGFPICSSRQGMHGQCHKSPHLLREVKLFNGIDIMIGVHGATFMNTMFMAAGASVLEIFPKGINEFVYHDLCSRAELNYMGWREPDETKLMALFPNVTANQCFKEGICRRKIREQHMTISLARIEPILKRMKSTHMRRCLGYSHGADMDQTMAEKSYQGQPGEPKWMYVS